MDWSRILETMQQQDPLSWAAAAALAAGAALLAGTAWNRWRRRPTSGAPQGGRTPGRVPAGEEAAGAVVPSPAVPDVRLEELHARLTTAAVRLEMLSRRRGAGAASGLKTSRHPVEHVHRRGHA